RKNLNADVPVDHDSPSGKYTTVIKFVVSRDGTLSDIAAETNLGYGMEEEVLRIIKRSGRWIPAEQNHRKVNAYRRQPVTFVVEQPDGINITTKTPYTLFVGDNEVLVDIKKVRNRDLRLSITNGIIRQNEDGQFIAHVTEPGRVIIRIYSTKNGKELAAASFEVRAKN
ncbi:MAG: energy transducer TonB, partial [Ferruginibacter sp.]